MKVEFSTRIQIRIGKYAARLTAGGDWRVIVLSHGRVLISISHPPKYRSNITAKRAKIVPTLQTTSHVFMSFLERLKEAQT